MDNKSIHFITYSNNYFAQAKARLLKQAENFGGFKTITGYGPKDLPRTFIQYYMPIITQKRGGGYWIWRPIMLKNKLASMQDGEFLIYLDAGCFLNKRGKQRFNEYIDLLDKSEYGIMSIQMTGNKGAHPLLPERQWTTSQIFKYFGVSLNSKHANSGQYLSGVLVMKKNEHLLKIIDLVIKALEYDPLMFTDHYNSGQHPGFIENRHEQSIFSLIRKLHGSVVIDGDESMIQPFGGQESAKYPFWAARSRT